MTYEKAFEEVKKFIELAPEVETFNMALVAIYKQIPKPRLFDGVDTYTCPTCDNEVEDSEYCPNCGQRLEL